MAESHRVLLDTNILISAFVYGGKPEQALRLIFEKGFILVTSSILIGELTRTLLNKFKVSLSDVLAIEKVINETFQIVYPSQTIKVVRDETDNRVLEAAVAGRCDYLITGDKDLLILKEYRGIKIIKPAQFLKILEVRK